MIGLDAFGINSFRSYSPAVRDIQYMELKNGIYDEVHIREKTTNVDKSNIKQDWQIDTLLLAKFMEDLEAGNINNEGIQIANFVIKRRKLNEIRSVTLGYKNFVNNNQFVYEDYTQTNDEFIYSIVPVGENDLEGRENSLIVKSDFSGWFLVDRSENEVLPFDKFISGNGSTVSTSLNQSRTQIDTLTKYPSFFYSDQEYHEFQLQATFIPEEWQRSGNQYEDVLNQFIRSHKPFLVKGSSGEIYVADVHTPSKSAPSNTYGGYDYMELTINLTEIMDYDEYMESVK